MTISSENRVSGPYPCNGSQTVFAFNFKVFKKADVRVVRAIDGVETDLVLDTDFTVTLNADQDVSPGGSITTLTAYATGVTVTITSQVAYTQPTDMKLAGGYYLSAINDALDRLAMQVLQLKSAMDRAVTLPISGLGGLDPTSLVFGVDGSGEPILRLVSDINLDTLTLTPFAATLLDDANAATARSTLGLGTAATANVGTGANQLVQLDGSGKLPALDASQLVGIETQSLADYIGLRFYTTGSDTGVYIYIDQLLLRDTSGNVVLKQNLTLGVDLTALGVNGLDSGSNTANTNYMVYAIYNPTTDTVAALASTNSSNPIMPSGYTYKSRLGWVRSSSGASPAARYLYAIFKINRDVFFRVVAGTISAALPKLSSGTQGNPTTGPTFVPITSVMIPETAAEVEFLAYNGGGAILMSTEGAGGVVNSTTNPSELSFTSTNTECRSVVLPNRVIPAGFSGQWYYAASSATAGLYLKGYRDSI
ncbi:hypothetical protein [Methylomonas koyamae]|uniref:hypothetical protein n=1 Tax=Methylomonas koyamae TaxID=702114 RepID=UPI0011288D40|nr:hypothetical protein [Methylomonas koyamae]TPQ24944.1 hypothetical protein C2U68_17360 [Methylomonas koyamae]